MAKWCNYVDGEWAIMGLQSHKKMLDARRSIDDNISEIIPSGLRPAGPLRVTIRRLFLAI